MGGEGSGAKQGLDAAISAEAWGELSLGYLRDVEEGFGHPHPTDDVFLDDVDEWPLGRQLDDAAQDRVTEVGIGVPRSRREVRDEGFTQQRLELLA